MTAITSSSQLGSSVISQLTSGQDGLLDVGLVVESLLFPETGMELASLQKKLTLQDEKRVGFSLLESALSGLSQIMESIVSDFNGSLRKVTVSDPSSVSFRSGDSVSVGSYTVETLALASKQSISIGGFGSPSALVGEGTLTFATGSYEAGVFNQSSASIDVSIPAGTTAEEAVDLINASGASVQAYLVKSPAGYEIAIASKTTGANSAFNVSVSAAPADPLNNFNYNETVKSAALTQTASNARVLFDGVALESSTNQFNNVISGFDFTVSKLSLGSPVSVVVEDDIAKSTAAINDFIESYNYAIDVFDFLASPEAGEDSKGVLFRDPDMKLISRSFESMSQMLIAGYGGSSSLTELGVQYLDDGSGKIELNTSVYDKAIAANPNAVKDALAQIGTTTNPAITFVSAADSAVAKTYDPIEITVAPATAKLLSGASVGLTVDATNNTFSVLIDGVEKNIQLDQRVYGSQAELATEIESKINVSYPDKSVSVSWDGSSYVIDSGVMGSASTLEIGTTTAGFESLTGFASGQVATGVDVIGKVGGDLAIGVGNRLEVILGDGRGLKFDVSATAPGTYGSFTLKNGAAKSLSLDLKDLFKSDGIYTQIINKYDDAKERYDDRIDMLNKKSEELRIRYTLQYSAINAAIMQFDQIGKQLQAQFDAWNSKV